MSRPRVLFFGTPAFAQPTLERLVDAGYPVTVVTQPDRPRGRGQRVTSAPIKAFAEARGLPVLQPDRLSEPAWLDQMMDAAPDVAVVAAYGRLLPQRVLDVPRLGFVNVHASLLPRWRGAAPIHRAILAGDTETGVTIMRVVLALDAGPMLAHASTPISEDETSADLERRLATMGAALLVTTLERVIAGRATDVAQDPSLVTYASRLDRRDGPIDWTRSARDLHNQIRGLQPWPLAETRLNGRRLKLHRSSLSVGDAARVTHTARPGTITDIDRSGLVVATGHGTLRVLDVQPEGRAAMPVAAYLNGTAIAAGDRFESL